MFLFRKLRQMKLKKAEAELMASQQKCLPSRQFPIDVLRDGDRWMCVFMCDPQTLLTNVVAYGESPAQAVSNFDHLWLGSPDFLIDQEEEEEQF